MVAVEVYVPVWEDKVVVIVVDAVEVIVSVGFPIVAVVVEVSVTLLVKVVVLPPNVSPKAKLLPATNATTTMTIPIRKGPLIDDIGKGCFISPYKV